MNDYIRLSRKILSWEWYTDTNTKVLFLHMLLKANWKDGRFQGMEVPRGSFVSSIRNLAEETRLTERQVRTCLKHLETTGEVTHKGHSKYSVFTVKNYDRYQTIDTQKDNQVTGNRQTSDKQVTTIEKGKKERSRKESTLKGTKEKRFTPPTLEDVIGYCQENGYEVDARRFVDFYGSKGWMVGKNKMKDWKAAVRNWARQDVAANPGIRPPKRNSFHNFHERQYDYDALEAELLKGQMGGARNAEETQ